MKKNKFFLYLTLLFCFCTIISTYFFQFSLIQGNSMLPTYRHMQFIIINKQCHQYQSGDVIVFYNQSLDAYLTKRIVACPGDTLEIKNSTLYVNNQPSPVSLPNIPINYAGIARTPITLSQNEYFVLGDNYDYSKDSRYSHIGCIAKDDILGKVIPQIPIH